LAIPTRAVDQSKRGGADAIAGVRPPARVLIVLSVFFLCYARVIVGLIDQWSANAMFSYGFAVPLISGYLAWTRAEALRNVPSAPDYATAIPLTVLGAVGLAVGTLGALVGVQGLSLVMTLTGVVLLLFGREVFRILAFPLAYLLLMVPIWAYPLEQLHVPSQRLSGEIAARMMEVLGVPAIRQDTLLLLPKVTLEVLRECSGVNQLVALLVMVVPAGYLWLRTWPARLVLLTLGVVVAYVCNGARIAVIGWMANNGWRDASLTGPGHLLEGLGISVAGYLVLGGCLSLLARAERPDDRRPRPAAAAVRQRRPLVDAGVVLVLVLAAASPLVAQRFDVTLTGDLRALPRQLGEWRPTDRTSPTLSRFPAIAEAFVGAYPSPAGERRFERIDDEVVLDYAHGAGTRLRLYVGYYRRQNQGKELAGDAAHVLQSAASDVSLEVRRGTVRMKEVVARSAGRELGLLYWYDVNGRLTSDVYIAKGYTILDALTRARTNGAVVMVAWEPGADQTPEAARELAFGFVQQLLPELRPLLPS
jgi:EpsI family protein